MRNLKTLIRDEVLGQIAYPAEIVSCRIKLDANENPFPLPSPLQHKLLSAMEAVPLNRYPEPGSPGLRRRFAGYFNVHEDMIIMGNGSDEIIQILCIAASRPGASVMIPVPTFAMYRISSLNCGLRVLEVPLNGSFQLDMEAMLQRIAAEAPAITFLAYPNNPTANCWRREDMEAILKASSGLVVVDEAYSHFSGQSILPLMKQYDNLVILRTLSKVGLAALRIGILIGPAPLVRELNKIRLPYNLNTLSQAAAHFYLDEEAFFLKQIGEILMQRDKLFAGLNQVVGVRPYPTDANFVFFSCNFDLNQLYRLLLEKGVLIKPFHFTPPLNSGIRVTVGSDEENEEFLKILKGIMAV